jgi:hypothetical protein
MMDPAITASIIGAVAVLGGQQWLLHHRNRKDAAARERHDLMKDNRLMVLLENFPLHIHDVHQGIRYPIGLDPRIPRDV